MEHYFWGEFWEIILNTFFCHRVVVEEVDKLRTVYFFFYSAAKAERVICSKGINSTETENNK